MVVAASALQRRTEKCLTGHIDHPAKDTGFVFVEIGRTMLPVGEVQEAGSHNRLVDFVIGREPRFGKEVSSKCFSNKLVVGKVIIECPNEVVAIPICVGHGIILFEGLGFCIAYEIKPMSGPFFSKMR